MKANEFVKKFGLSHTVYLLKDTELTEFAIHSNCAGKHYMDTVCVSDLKRLVESHELVEKHGGLLNVKNSFQMERDCGGVDMTPFGKKLYQAIADVESCQ